MRLFSPKKFQMGGDTSGPIVALEVSLLVLTKGRTSYPVGRGFSAKPSKAGGSTSSSVDGPPVLFSGAAATPQRSRSIR